MAIDYGQFSPRSGNLSGETHSPVLQQALFAEMKQVHLAVKIWYKLVFAENVSLFLVVVVVRVHAQKQAV